MNEGRIIQVGSPAEIYDQPVHRFVAEFFGSPSINLLDGKLFLSKKDRYAFQPMSLQSKFRPCPNPAESVVLGLRPETY